MYKDILNILQCPICKSKFRLREKHVENEEIVEGTLTCENNHPYAIHRGVIDFCSKEQDGFNQWSDLLKETDYEELDQKIELQKPEKEKEQQQIHLASIIEEVAKLKSGYLVDIASGRGMLLTKLVEIAKESVHIIATDLSFEILVYDRIKLKKINPKAHVSFVACDATAMPMQSSFSDVVVSFFGVANMLGIVGEGVHEAARITKEGGKFLNAFLTIKETSKGFESVKKICQESNMIGAERTYLDEVMKELHGKYFSAVITHEIVADIRENTENNLDLLPYPGEWFAYVTYESIK